MKTSSKTLSVRPGNHGFALVITISLMVLLVVVAVGLLTLSTISLRSSSSQEAMATARANARLAMMLAIGELQKQTGHDQSITMPSGLPVGTGTTEPTHPNWTGAVNVRNLDPKSDSKQSTVAWLVSGHQPDPAKTLTQSAELNKGDALKLGSYLKENSQIDLLAPVVNLTQGKSKSRLAWWVGDEGTKARVDLARPEGTNPADRERLARAQSPLEFGIDRIDSTWSAFAPGGKIAKNSLISVDTTALAAGRDTIPNEYFNDITTGGFGLPTNVIDGGMKADLSLIFDKTQKTKKFALTYFGANTPSTSSHNGANIEMFAAPKDPKKFFLSDTLSKNGTVAVGPNWGVLWNYASLWRNVSSQQIPLVGAFPVPWSDLRMREWLPYTNHNVNMYQNDLQHTNSSVAPVISTLQMGFRLKSQLVSNDPKTGKQYKAQVEIKPLLGIWNPYNVAIKAAPYRFDWALYPYFRFNYAKPSGNGKYTDGRLTTLWLRKEWTSGSGDIATDVDQTGGRYFSMETEAIDIQPGEFRLFSVTKPIDLKKQGIHKLESGWSEKGAFFVDLTYKTKNDKGEEVYAVRTVPSGYRAWFGDIILEDTLSSDFDKEFPTSASSKNKASSTWFTLKSGNNVLFRTTDLWNGEKTAKIMVPEPVVSGSSGGLDTKKETHLIDDIAGEKYVPHVATWSFFNRTTTQLLDKAANQRLRLLADSNPRALVTKPSWDGSKADASGRKGWHFTSHLMGGSHDPAPKGQVGDGNNDWPNRGLIGEGGKAEPEPQISDAKRYAGYGGPTNTPTGQANVVLYDVPRSPLVSIGQFQHAQLARYNFEPGFIVGNSYANPRIPLNDVAKTDFAGTSGLTVVDTSYEVNSKLWDRYFFSTLGLDYTNASGSSFDKAFDFQKLVSGEKPLPNPRMQFAPLSGDTSIDKILADKNNADRAPEAIASRILVKGAFNVNSTSKTAWKAFLSTMGASQLPTVSKSGTSWTKLSWNDPKGIRFNRFGHVLSADAYEKGGSGGDPEFWRGWRKLSEAELDSLATEIVKEVRERGPFRSLAEFVNRKPFGTNADHQRKGGLQAALDRTINAGLPKDIGNTAVKPEGDHFSAAVSGENEALGHASYLMQGDVLQALAPAMQVRSDYFRIRTSGEALDAAGKVIARATCEAFVQRTPDYVDPQDLNHLNFSELKSKANQQFGRRYQIVSFRWLSDSEI